MRNYAVLHIAAEEARIFVTKERAPLMLCIECFRPEELQLLDTDYEQTRRRSNSLHHRKSEIAPDEMELPLLDKESVKMSKGSIMSRKKSTKHSAAPAVNPYLEATRELEREIENRASKAIILN